MHEIRILVDPLARRWQIARRHDSGTTIVVATDYASISIGRNAMGAVVEMVIDAAALDTATLAAVESHFGRAVRNEVAQHDPSVELDRIVSVDDVPTPAVAVAVGGRHLAESTTEWSTELDGHRAVVSAAAHALRITIHGAIAAGAWVAVRVASTGALVAAMPVRHHDGGGLAECTFGLDLTADDLHFELVDDPFAQSDPAERVAARIDALIDEAEQVGRRRPGRGAQLADGAALLADSVNDHARRLTARLLAHGLRRARRLRVGLALTIAAAVAALIIATIISGSTPSTDAIDPSPTANAEPSTGPLIATFSEGESVMLAMVGARPVGSPGGQWPLAQIEFTTRELGVFATVDEGEDVARQRCAIGAPTSMMRGALSSPSVAIELWPVDDETASPYLIGQVPANPQEDYLTAVPNTCSALAEVDGMWVATHLVVRAGQSAIFDLPSDMSLGLWETRMTYGVEQPVDVAGSIVIEISAD